MQFISAVFIGISVGMLVGLEAGSSFGFAAGLAVCGILSSLASIEITLDKILKKLK